MVLSAGAGDVMTVSRVREDSPQYFPMTMNRGVLREKQGLGKILFRAKLVMAYKNRRFHKQSSFP